MRRKIRFIETSSRTALFNDGIDRLPVDRRGTKIAPTIDWPEDWS